MSQVVTVPKSVTVGAALPPIVTPSIVPPLISQVVTVPRSVTVGAAEPPIVTPSIVPAFTSTEFEVLNANGSVIQPDPFQNFHKLALVSRQTVPVCLLVYTKQRVDCRMPRLLTESQTSVLTTEMLAVLAGM